MHVVLVQLDIAWEDKRATFARVEELLADADVPSGSLIVLPEMFATGFSLNVPKIAETEHGPTHDFLRQLAKQHQANVMAGIVQQADDGRGLNRCVVFDPTGKELDRYTKLHPFSFASETDHYAPGRSIHTFSLGDVVVCPLICYDLRFPEAFRHGVSRGAKLFTVIANWPTPRVSHWTALLRARAIENQAYVVGVNRCGSDPKLDYPGKSVVFDPKGEVIAEAESDEQVIAVELDMEMLEHYRSKFPALRDLHRDLLGL